MTSNPVSASGRLVVGDRVRITHYSPPSDTGTLRKIEEIGPVHRDRTHYVEFDVPPPYLPELPGIWLRPDTLSVLDSPA